MGWGCQMQMKIQSRHSLGYELSFDTKVVKIGFLGAENNCVTQTNRQTDRQTDRQKEWQTDKRQTDRQKDRQTDST